jgi:SAM-dependent methyltransferase
VRSDPRSFDALYRDDADPWAFTTSRYELDKYDTTVAGLHAARYTRCFEPACSIGVLTERLAVRADAVVACDASPVAIGTARERLRDVQNVEFVAAVIPEWWPSGTFDLVVLSELGYYWDIPGWRDVLRRVAHSLAPGGELMAVHWLGSSPDHVLDGATVHRELAAKFGPPDLHLERFENSDGTANGFVLDRWTGVAHD